MPKDGSTFWQKAWGELASANTTNLTGIPPPRNKIVRRVSVKAAMDSHVRHLPPAGSC